MRHAVTRITDVGMIVLLGLLLVFSPRSSQVQDIEFVAARSQVWCLGQLGL